jgi:hypothetical protein
MSCNFTQKLCISKNLLRFVELHVVGHKWPAGRRLKATVINGGTSVNFIQEYVSITLSVVSTFLSS